MNRRGGGPERELHGVDVIDLFCKLNYSRVEPGFDRRREFPGVQFDRAQSMLDDARVVTSLIPISRYYPGIKQNIATTWATVGLEAFDKREQALDAFKGSEYLIHTPEKCQWAPAQYFGDDFDSSFWIFVVTSKLVVDPWTGLLDVPQINWLPEYGK